MEGTRALSLADSAVMRGSISVLSARLVVPPKLNFMGWKPGLSPRQIRSGGAGPIVISHNRSIN